MLRWHDEFVVYKQLNLNKTPEKTMSTLPSKLETSRTLTNHPTEVFDTFLLITRPLPQAVLTKLAWPSRSASRH